MNNPELKRYVMSDQELRAVQMTELEMLIEIDRICKLMGIRYNIEAGTALGAVRHGGFIPWDDDADVIFLRPEYEKFRAACVTELDKSRFYFQDYRSTQGYRWGHGKLRRKDTSFIRLNQEYMPYEQGICIDLFPYDRVPDSKLLQPLHNFACFLFRKATYSKVGRVSSKGFVKLCYGLLFRIPEIRLYRALDRFIARNNIKDNTKNVRMLTYPLPKNGRYFGYVRGWFEELTEIEFEGHMFPIPKDYNGYLSFKYGDYMTLPDEKDRWIHPISELKLLEKNNSTASK